MVEHWEYEEKIDPSYSETDVNWKSDVDSHGLDTGTKRLRTNYLEKPILFRILSKVTLYLDMKKSPKIII
jgi:hypothetical protein